MAYEHVPLMYQPQYQTGRTPGAPENAPWCWGNTQQYNSEDRVCRSCPVQGTCRSEVIRKDMLARPVGATPVAPPPSTSYSPYAIPQSPYASQPARTIPINTPPVPPTTYYQPQPIPTVPNAQRYAPAQTQPQQPRPLQPPPLQYGYGSTYDPMFYSLAQVPEPFRPQVQGESFLERVMKNMVLSGIEAVMKEALLGIRQLFWWPMAPKQPAAEAPPIDVTPPRR